MSEPDVEDGPRAVRTNLYRRQILTTKVYPCTVSVKIFLMAVDP